METIQVRARNRKRPDPVWMRSPEVIAKRLESYASKRRLTFWGNAEVLGPDECWGWKRPHKSRYPKISIGGDQSDSAHRVAYRMVHGEIPPGMVIMHKCDNPKCVNPNHLELGTHADNQHDKCRKQRQARGERQGASKLTEGQVIEIRRRVAAGEPAKAIAAEFNIVSSHVHAIATRRWWSHVV